MASISFFSLAILTLLSLSSIAKVQSGSSSRKLLAPTFPNIGRIPGLRLPPLQPVTEWPEYRLPPPIITIPPVTAKTKTTSTKP
ncbi:unnamed protein product [Lathyrus oleraceus]